MTIYVRNRSCRCVRCQARGLMGGAILVTLGVLFMLDNFSIISFDQSWPVLLIVIGLISYAARSGSMEGHVQPSWVPRTYSQGPQGTETPGSQSGLGSQQGGDPRR